jgi:hypothetical protein
MVMITYCCPRLCMLVCCVLLQVETLSFQKCIAERGAGHTVTV